MFDRSKTAAGVFALAILMAQMMGGIARGADPKEFVDPFTNPTDDPALPRVLIIGDSISIAYTTTVRRELAGVANVHRVPGNAAFSANGLAKIESWLGEGDWDLVHFNFGLWDWYGWKQERVPTKDEYVANLQQIVTKLKATGAKVIFGTTTPPCDEAEHKIKVHVSDEYAKNFNNAAAERMKKEGIAVNDLYAHISPERKKYTLAKADVHWNRSGSLFLGKKVAAEIARQLP